MKLLRRFWSDFVRKYRWWYIFGIICLILTNVLTVSIPKFIEYAIDSLGQSTATSSTTDFALSIILCGLGIIVVRTLSRTLFFNPGRTVEFDVKSQIFKHLVTQPQRFFDTNRPGDLISRGTNDVNSMRALIGFGTLQLFNVIFVLSLTLAQMFWIDSFLTMLVLVPLSLGGLFMGIAVKKLFALVVRLLKQLGHLSDRILESYSGAAVIQSYDAFEAANRRFDERNDEFLEISISMLKIRSFLMPIVSLVGELCVVLVLFVGGHKVIEEGSSFTLGQLSAFIAYITILVNGLRSLGFLVGATQRGYLALGRIYEILDQPPGRTLDGEHPAFVDMETTFEIRDLSFTYPGAAEPTLRNISLTIEAGQTVGVFGYTGSGKTTLMSILARVYDPPVNTVFLNGVDILDIPVHNYWSIVALSRQSSFLFSHTIRENIALNTLDSEGVDEPRLAAAVRDAAFQSEIEHFSKGLDTRVGERGVTLSGGQRQRASLARLFYRDFEVVLLDDVMSAVDHATENTLIDAVYRRSEAQTKLLVSHRTSVLTRADKIIVLKNGQLIDQGAHESLIRRDGPYQEAFQLQQEESSRSPK
jgi:ATP-binding cassette, subfamily B, multidrug efflux pump